jgi:hypothetical protein
MSDPHDTGDLRDAADTGDIGSDGHGDDDHASQAPSAQASFDEQYRPLLRKAFVAIVERETQAGEKPAAQARMYAERGKPDFTLAYLLVTELPDAEKREVYAAAHERRAALTEQRARQFSREFARPFPFLFTDAAKDRALARQIRAGRAIARGAGRQLPLM